MKVELRINDVLGLCALAYGDVGQGQVGTVLFAVRHTLAIEVPDDHVTVLADSPGQGRVLQLDVRACQADLGLTTLDFANDGTAPETRAALFHTAPISVSGEVVVEADPHQPRVFRVTLGALRFPLQPMFDKMRPGTGKSSFLASFWPTLPADAAGLDYVLTPWGLAVEGVLAGSAAARDMLLLPRCLPDAPDGDAAWCGSVAPKSVHVWQSLPGIGDHPVRSNAARIVKRLTPDAGKQAWPVGGATWAMLRWLAIGAAQQPLLDLCLASWAPGVTVDRLETRGDGPATLDDCPELVVQFDLNDTAHGGLVLEHEGGICVVDRANVAARCAWAGTDRSTVLTGDRVRTALQFHRGQAAPGVVQITVRSGADGAATRLGLAWPGNAAPSAGGVRLALDPTAMLCAGLDGAGGQGAAPQRPAWLLLDGDVLQLDAKTFPVDDPGHQATPAAGLLSATADTPQALRGGLPLDVLGGPDGMTAWAVNQQNGDAPHLMLRLTRTDVALDLSDAILVWRTPGWWLTGDPQSRPALPRLGSAFAAGTGGMDDAAPDVGARVQAAFGSLLRQGLWVGRAGQGAAERSGGWVLAADRSGVRWQVPAAAAAQAVVWSAMRGQYFVQTVPAGGQRAGGPLLDPYRALLPLRCTSAAGLQLRLERGRLPALDNVPYPGPGALPKDWAAFGGEVFHPNIPGLVYEPGSTVFSYRHGPAILAEGYLRTTADGQVGDAAALASLATVRPKDDVAIANLTLLPPKTAVFPLTGWLPAPQTVSVTKVSIDTGGAQPALRFVALGGKQGQQEFPVEISSIGAGFGTPVYVAGDGNRSWLTDDPALAKPFSNFGQSLIVHADVQALEDGQGRRWGPYALGRRELDLGGKPVARRVTGMLNGSIAVAGLGEVPLGLSLVDVDAMDPAAVRDWDLVGRGGAAVRIGPFPLLADELSGVGDTGATLRVRIGAPRTAGDAAPMVAKGTIPLSFTASDQGWLVEVADGDFAWHADHVRFEGTVRVASIFGRVRKDTDTHLEITRVVLTTALGPVAIACKPAAPVYCLDEADCNGLVVSVDGADGQSLATAFELAWDRMAGWAPRPRGDKAFCLAWSGAGPEKLVYSLADNVIRFATSDRDWLLDLEQAGPLRWLARNVDLAKGEAGLVGCLEQRHPDGIGKSTSVRLAYQRTVRLTAAQVQARFGPCAAASEVREDIESEWRCSAWTGPAAATTRTLTGCIGMPNTFEFDRALPGGAGGERLVDQVSCFFDRVACDGAGLPVAGKLYALVDHRLVDGQGKVRLQWQAPQALDLIKAPDGTPGVACTAIVLIYEPDRDAAPRPVGQIAYGSDQGIALAVVPPASGRRTAVPIRVPLRNVGAPVVLHLPAPASLPGVAFPLVEQPRSPLEPADGFWHARGPLAGELCAETLARQIGQQVAADFDGKNFPVSGALLAEWAVFGAEGWHRTALLAQPVGMTPTRYLAAIPDPGTPGTTAVPVALLVADPGRVGGVRTVARALIQEGTAAQVADWAVAETVRRSLTTCAFALAQGQPSSSVLVPRRLDVAGLDEESYPLTLPEHFPAPAYARRLELLRAAEGAPGDVRPLVARSDQDAVLELSDAIPLVAGHESATAFRLVLNRLVSSSGATAPPGPGSAIRKVQSVDFRSSSGHGEAGLLLPPVHAVPEVAGLVAPLSVEARVWTARPGDTVRTRWGLGDRAALGPSVDALLRAPRSSPGGEFTATLEGPVRVDASGTAWSLYELTTRRVLGERAAVPDTDGIGVALVTPGSVLQGEALSVNAGGGKAVFPPLALATMTRMNGTASSTRMAEPLLAGLAPTGTAIASAGELSLAWAVLDKNHPPPLSSPIPDVDGIASDAGATQAWNGTAPPRLVRLSSWQVWQAASSMRPAERVVFSDGVGRSLARLLALVLPAPDAKDKHWLLTTETAELVVLVRTKDGLTLRHVAGLAWQERAASDPPERALVVRDGMVLGFGDLDGRAGIELSDKRFVLTRSACALGAAHDGEDAAALSAWVFGPTGACLVHVPGGSRVRQ